MRLLLADDDAMMLRLVTAALEPLGYEMIQAHDGREAWSHLGAEDSPPHIAVMDWEMPEITGPELCRRARALDRPVPTYCLLLTGRGNTEDVVVGLEQGADDYVVKPFKPEELRARVRAAVRIVELQQHLADRMHALEGALAEVRQLQSLLPVCAWCKKIRDEENYWELLETYVAKRLDVRFSHGVCPDCRQKFLQPQIERVRRESGSR
jgi:sigma-B regulation protein RsbU (phosphoserine phosphatase)